MQTPRTTDPRAALPAQPAAPTSTAMLPSSGARQLFPPKDADAETRRRWLASSPWPEIVFASAGA